MTNAMLQEIWDIGVQCQLAQENGEIEKARELESRGLAMIDEYEKKNGGSNKDDQR